MLESKDDLEKKLSQLDTLHTENDCLKGQVESLEQAFMVIEEGILSKDLEKLSKKLQILHSENAALYEKVKTTILENSLLKEDVAKLYEENSTLKEDVAKLYEENSALKEKLNNLISIHKKMWRHYLFVNLPDTQKNLFVGMCLEQKLLSPLYL